MLSLSAIKGNAGYYSHEDNYYASGSLDSRWMGAGAEQLGLNGAVQNVDMDEVRQGKLPDGTDLSRMVDGVNRHRAGYDLTFSAPKSISVMALVAGDTRFTDAHNRAVAVAMEEVEQLVSTRITRDGKTDTVLTGSMVAALYNHDTSRDLDPQLHTHALVFNATFAEGKWRSLASDTRMKTGFSETVYGAQIALGNLYRTALRREVESMGFETVAAGKHDLWELKDVPVEPFSSRSQAITEAAGPDASAKARDVAALDTRQAKAWADPDLLRADWQRRLTERQFDPATYAQEAATRATEGAPGPQSDIPQEAVRQAVSEAISMLSDKKVQFTWSEVLAGTVNRLPASPGLFNEARKGITAAIDSQQLIPLDREKGLFTSDIHLLNELSVHQLARTALSEQPVLDFPARSQARAVPAGDAVSVLSQDRSPVAIMSGRGGAQALRERTEDVAMMARAQGREALVIATDSRSAAFLSESEHLAGAVMSRTRLQAETVLPLQGTVIVDRAERLSLKETVLLQEKALRAGAQLIFMDSENRQGTGSALSVLKGADVPQYRFYETVLPEVRLVSEPDKRARHAQLAGDYVRLSAEGRDVIAQTAGVRERGELTDAIRDARRSAGELGTEEHRIKVLEPVWQDAKTRHQRDSYRAGMVMEQWDAEKKTMTRYTIDRVADMTNSLVLQAEDGSRRVLKLTKTDSSWSLYRSSDITVSEGDRVRALGRESAGKILSGTRLTVSGMEQEGLRLRDGDRELLLPVDRAVKLSHDYVEAAGAGTSTDRTVLAAVGPRALNSELLNTLAHTGGDIRVYTPLAPDQAARRVEGVAAVRLASDRVREAGGGDSLDVAMRARRDGLMPAAEQAVSLAIPRAQAGSVALSETRLLAASLESGVPVQDVRTEIARQKTSGELIALDTVDGTGNRLLVPRVEYEMEKSIIRYIAEGKDAVEPLLPLTPAHTLEGLTDGQRKATRSVLESADRFIAIQGYAGVGKTTQFRAVMSALNVLSEAARPEIIGLGPTHRAVYEMREAGVEARTLASFLSETRQTVQGGVTPDFRNVVFLTDESSMVGNRDMAELYQLVAAGGGRMVSSGDTAQLQAISTGQPFRLVQQRSAIDTTVMKEIVRQTPALRPAVESIIAGQVSAALDRVNAVTPQQVPRREDAWVPEHSVAEVRRPETQNEQKQAERTLPGIQPPPEEPASITERIRDDWMGRTPQAQQQTLIVAALNADRHAINTAIHEARHARGDTGEEERTFSTLERVRVPDNALRNVSTFEQHKGAVAMVNDAYWRIAEVSKKEGIVTLENNDGDRLLISPQENTALDIALYRRRELTLSVGDRVRFTRSDTDRGYVANSLWAVSGFAEDGGVRFRQGEQEKTVNPQKADEDRHIDLAYALTVHGVQGASERFVIALAGTDGARKNMATLESAYVTLSRAKEHVQVYTDNREGWERAVKRPDRSRTAHDLLGHNGDRDARTGNRLMDTASPLDRTALGRRVLTENGLTGDSMARFIAAGKKYPSPCVALPVWTRHGKEAGALLTEIRLTEADGQVLLSDKSRLRGGEDAQFAGLQASRNGQTLMADNAREALQLARENPESGVVIRLDGGGTLLNARRITGGRITLTDDIVQVAEAIKKEQAAEDERVLLPQERQQKLEDDAEKAARLLAEKLKDVVLPDVRLTDIKTGDSASSSDETRRLRDVLESEERRQDALLRDAASVIKTQAQPVRDRMLRTEREWVVNERERGLDIEKTLGGD